MMMMVVMVVQAWSTSEQTNSRTFPQLLWSDLLCTPSLCPAQRRCSPLTAHRCVLIIQMSADISAVSVQECNVAGLNEVRGRGGVSAWTAAVCADPVWSNYVIRYRPSAAFSPPNLFVPWSVLTASPHPAFSSSSPASPHPYLHPPPPISSFLWCSNWETFGNLLTGAFIISQWGVEQLSGCCCFNKELQWNQRWRFAPFQPKSAVSGIKIIAFHTLFPLGGSRTPPCWQ